MTHTEPHADSLESALHLLRDHMGSRWSGREGEGRTEMLRHLQETFGYDKHHAKTIIDTLITMNRLQYHPAGESGSKATAHFTSGLPFTLGHWQIGPEYE